MNFLQKLRAVFFRSRPELKDPVFGEIQFDPRFGEWFAGELPLPGKLAEVSQISIVADESGPDESHRQAFQRLLEEYDKTIRAVETFLYDDYREWCRIARGSGGDDDLTKRRGFPILQSSHAVLEHAHFESIEVSGANSERLPQNDVYIVITIGWDEEHNRAVFIKDGRYVDYEVV